jgi:hypothetical protein
VKRGLGAHGAGGLLHQAIRPCIRLRRGARTRAIDLHEGGVLREASGQDLRDPFADPLFVAAERGDVEGHDQNGARLDRGRGGA